MTSDNNRRIAKNTMLLYFRMLLIMGVSLFTVRIVLNTLGEVDYGLYNVVGGLVIMFSFLSNTMAGASQRFFAFELGCNNITQLKRLFSMTMTIYLMITIVILILAETVGLWFLNTQMTIPPNRIVTVNWVYQFTILSFFMTMLTIPYNSVIIAREQMNVYAYVSILEAFLKMSVAYLLVLFSFDKLKLYSILMFLVTGLITFIYRSYCKRQFEECNYKFYWNKSLFNELIGFSGWNLFGALASLFNNQGMNILLNIFFGPVVNAARAIAYQIYNAINQFGTNFYTAVRPQITKYYALGETKQMINLVFKSSKLSYFLLFILSMPILLEPGFILTAWLKQVPDYVILFTRLVIIEALINTLSYPFRTAAQATGRIKIYQSVVGGVMLLALPSAYLLLKSGAVPQSIFYIAIASAIICQILRILLVRNMIQLSATKYIKQVIFPILFISIFSYIAPLTILFQLDSGFKRFLIVVLTGLLSSSIIIFYIGLTRSERSYIKLNIHQVIEKLKRNSSPFLQK